MRVRIHDTEVAAAFMGLARLRPDVVLAPAPSASAGGRPPTSGGRHDVFEVGLLGSFNSEDRTTELASLVRTWTCQLRGRFCEVAVEVVS